MFQRLLPQGKSPSIQGEASHKEASPRTWAEHSFSDRAFFDRVFSSPIAKLSSVVSLAGLLSSGASAAEPTTNVARPIIIAAIPATPPSSQVVIQKIALSHVIDELCAMSQFNVDGSPRPIPKDGFSHYEVSRAPLHLRLSDAQKAKLAGKGLPAESFEVPTIFNKIPDGALNPHWLSSVYSRVLVQYMDLLVGKDAVWNKSPTDPRHAQVASQLSSVPQYGCQLTGYEIGVPDKLLKPVAFRQTQLFQSFLRQELATLVGSAAGSSIPSTPLTFSEVTALRDGIRDTSIRLTILQQTGINELFNGRENCQEYFYSTWTRNNANFAQTALVPTIFSRNEGGGE